MTNQDLLITRIKQLSKEEISALLDAATIMLGNHSIGAKPEKRGISSEYVCICTGIQRNGDAYAATVNRAKPDAEELSAVFASHIADGTLVLGDGLKSYNALPAIANCTVKDCA